MYFRLYKDVQFYMQVQCVLEIGKHVTCTSYYEEFTFTNSSSIVQTFPITKYQAVYVRYMIF